MLDESGSAVANLRADPAQGGPVHLAHQAQILISEIGRLEVPAQVICRLHQISLDGGRGGGGGGGAGSWPVMRGPGGPAVQCGAAPRARAVEWHGYVLRAGAVTVGRGEDAAVPEVGLEVVAVGVVGHGAHQAATAAVGWRGGRGGPLHGGLECVGLSHAHLGRVAHCLEVEGGRLLAEVAPAVLEVGGVSERVLTPAAHLLLLWVRPTAAAMLLLLQMLQLLLLVLLGVGVARRQVVHGRRSGRRVTPHQGGGSRLRGADDAVGRGESGRGRVAVHGDPGAGADEHVATDGAGVGDLALAHGRGPGAVGPRLAELVDLMHDGSQVGLPALVQPGDHGQRNG